LIIFYLIKEFVQTKMSLNNRKFLIWKEIGRGLEREREAVRERGACGRMGGWAGQ
jgi:hypothetical protein